MVVAFTHLAAAVCLFYLLMHYPIRSLFTWWALFWLTLSLIANYSAMPIFGTGSPNTLSPGFTVSGAIMVLFNPLAAAIIIALGTLNEGDLKRKRPRYLTLRSRSMFLVCATAGSVLFHALPGEPAATAEPGSVMARMVPVILVYFVVNTALVRLSIAVHDNERFFDRYPFTGDLLVGYLFMGFIAMVVVLLARQHQALALVVIGAIWGWRFSLEKIIELREINDQLVQSFADALDMRDHETAGHTRRVAALARLIGSQLGLSRRQLNDVYAAGSLHDLGKIGIPDAILLKADKLDRDEFEEIKKHPVMGAALLAPYRHLRNVTAIMRHHHEKFDGTGYPDGLSGEEIPIGARVITVADTFMVITDGRNYRAARSPREAIAEIERCSGTQFDPKVLKAFVTLDPDLILATLNTIDIHDARPVLRALQPNAVWSRLLRYRIA